MLSKLERKDKRRAIKGRAGADAELDWLTLNGLDPLVEAEIMQKSEAQECLFARAFECHLAYRIAHAQLDGRGTSEGQDGAFDWRKA